MKLTIELAKATALVQESLPLAFVLSNGPDPCDLPLDFESTNVLGLTLLDAEGNEVARADGYTAHLRFKPQAKRTQQAAMDVGRLGPGETMRWESDLLSYFDIASGRYQVSARLEFEPTAVLAESEPVAFDVRDNRCDWLSFHRDQMLLDLGVFVQQHDGEEESRTLFQLTRPAKPTNPWKAGVLDVPAGARPRLSEGSFVTADSFDHDFSRWVAWVSDGSLWLSRIEQALPSERRHEHALNLDSAELFGSPVQLADGGVSVLIGHAAGDAYGVACLEFDRDGKARGDSEVARFSSRPATMVSAADLDGRIHLLVADSAGAVKLISFAARRPAPTELRLPLADGDGPILGLRLDVKADTGTDAAAMMIRLARDEEGARLVLSRARMSDPTIVHSASALLPDLGDGEEIVCADVIQAPLGSLVGVVGTSVGGLFGVRPGKKARFLADIDPRSVGRAGLFRSEEICVYCFFPTKDRGIGSKRV